MKSARVTECPLCLEPVIHDPFADGLEDERSSEAPQDLRHPATGEPATNHDAQA